MKVLTAIFVNGPFVALAVLVILAPSKAFFDFSFPSYGRFHEGTRLAQQKVLPHPTMGHCLTVTALALSARRPFGPARFARGLDKQCTRCSSHLVGEMPSSTCALGAVWCLLDYVGEMPLPFSALSWERGRHLGAAADHHRHHRNHHNHHISLGQSLARPCKIVGQGYSEAGTL